MFVPRIRLCTGSSTSLEKENGTKLSATMETEPRRPIYNERVFELTEIISRENGWSNGISWNSNDRDGFLSTGNHH